MKRLFVVLTLLLALVSVPAVIHAQDANPATLAKYFPVETQMYLSIRTDDNFIDTFDTLLAGVRDKFPAILNVPKIGLRDTINNAFANGPVKFEDIRAWLGDTAALGINDLTTTAGPGRTTPETVGYFALEITDKAAATAFVESMSGALEDMAPSEENGFTVYRPTDESRRDYGFFALNDEVAILGINTGDLPAGGLDGSVKFSGTLDKLPADSYNALVYAELAPLMEASMTARPQAADALNAAGIDLTALNPLAIGFTVLDGKSLTVDLVEPSIPGLIPELGAIDPAFAANIPDNFSFVIHSGDLTTLVNTALNALEKASETTNNPVTRTQIAGLLQMVLSLDMDDDVLSWTTGDFAFLADMDMLPVLDQLKESIRTPEFDVRLGFVMDASADPEKAQKVVQSLSKLIMTQLEQPGTVDVKASMGEVGGVQALILEGVKLNTNEPMTVDLVLGANDKVFLLADRATAEAIFSGNFNSLANSAAYQNAGQYVLPGSVGVMYAEGAGIGDIVALGGTAFMAFRSGDQPDMTELIESLKFGYDLFDSATISAAPLDSGDILVRAILTVK